MPTHKTSEKEPAQAGASVARATVAMSFMVERVRIRCVCAYLRDKREAGRRAAWASLCAGFVGGGRCLSRVSAETEERKSALPCGRPAENSRGNVCMGVGGGRCGEWVGCRCVGALSGAGGGGGWGLVGLREDGDSAGSHGGLLAGYVATGGQSRRALTKFKIDIDVNKFKLKHTFVRYAKYLTTGIYGK